MRRRLGAQPNAAGQTDHDADHSDDAATDPNSLLPRWLPDGSAHDGWLAKVRVLMRREAPFYQLEDKLGTPGAKPVLLLRVIVLPSLIRSEMTPTLNQNARIAIFSVIGAVFLTFLFSTLAFRPLGRIGHMLDLVARGEFEPEKLPPDKTATDELSVMASKVSLLGQRLREPLRSRAQERL